jgi:hypothetical protein
MFVCGAIGRRVEAARELRHIPTQAELGWGIRSSLC